ncbi:hypothetical protein HETIRDRAFT_455213 [Heterobasidion irregulare TC 32-1]|uniref:Uncharacterized protein n=1 Tax=Heterobasidion irregulare (strain TC 32-1) TaxID=747525 RepID=W4JUI5_HETIT|nr:uncharacterized protein HETIRDRAFT_455213 [Heterobasidion irregulare TC 32-1]ETW76740.1 hypothetical protein HETIRDRAFT_455213 [Heterobasidion irregulare TC 32-1]
MASPETLVACFQSTFDAGIHRWRDNLKHINSQMTDVVDALTALCISEPGTFAAAAIEVHSGSPCVLYLATSDDAVGSLESHFQTLVWRSLQGVALSTNSTPPPLDSPAVDLVVEVYGFAWAAFYDRFAPEVEYYCTQFFPQVTVRRTVTRTKPANAELRNIVSTLGLLHLDDSGLLIYRSAQTAPPRRPSPQRAPPFEVNMHDDAVLSLWKEHKGVERPRADLDAQWDRRIIKPMQVEMVAVRL